MPRDSLAIDALADACAREARRLAHLGFMSCTAGNISAKLTSVSQESGDDLQVLMSPSGVDKSQLEGPSFIICDHLGQPLPPDKRKPSDETRLHLALYKATECGAVAHGHLIHAVALSLRDEAICVSWQGIEMQKAFAGTTTHACKRDLPIIANSQDMDILAAHVIAAMNQHVPAVLVRGHGVYAWGRTVSEAGRHLETVEWLCRVRLLTSLAT